MEKLRAVETTISKKKTGGAALFHRHHAHQSQPQAVVSSSGRGQGIWSSPSGHHLKLLVLLREKSKAMAS